MNETNKNSLISIKNTPGSSRKNAAESTQVTKLEDGQRSTWPTENDETRHLQISMRKLYKTLKNYLLSSEDDLNLQCPSSKIHMQDKDHIFVVVDSTYNEPLSIEINESKIITMDKKVQQTEMPSTSADSRNKSEPLVKESASKEVLIIDMNLKSENEISIDHVMENDDDSITLIHLREKALTLSKNASSASPLEACTSKSFVFGDSISTYEPTELQRAVDFLHEDNDYLLAAEYGNLNKLETTLRNVTNIQQRDQLGRNALHLAVCSGNIDVISRVLDIGVNPNVKDSVGMTPLSLCLWRRPSIRIVKLLFDHGVKLLPRVDSTDTGLFLQFVTWCKPTFEEEQILRLFIQKGALINDPKAPGGRQALHLAAMNDNRDLIALLIDLGADLYATNARGQTPKEFALAFRCMDAYGLLEDLEQIIEDSSSLSESSESST